MAMALVPAVLTLNVSPCSFSVAVDKLWRPRSDALSLVSLGRGQRGIAGWQRRLAAMGSEASDTQALEN